MYVERLITRTYSMSPVEALNMIPDKSGNQLFYFCLGLYTYFKNSTIHKTLQKLP